jgi:replicative DNA helicase
MITPDRILPHNIQLEKSVLGICLVYPDTINSVRLKPDMFYDDKHKKIFQAMREVSSKGACDLITVTEQLRKSGMLDFAGGAMYITKLTEQIFSDQQAEQYAMLIKEKYLLREYIRISYEIIDKSYQEDISDVIEHAEGSLFRLSDFTQSKEPRQISNCIDELLKDVEKIYTKEKSLIGIPSGYTSIDRKTGGWQPGNLIIIAGRPSMGKTALALALCQNSAKLNNPVGLFSLEMSDSEIAARFLSSVSGYTNVQIRNADINLDDLALKSNDIAGLPIVIDDTPGLSLMEMRSKVKKMILKFGVSLVIVDYLQLMTAEAGNREQEVATISRGLKAIAKEFDIPVIALSQLNREVENRADKRPRLADLRESGAIEQDADIVCFIFRPAVYGIKSLVIDKDEIPSSGMVLIDCAKNRNGALFTIPLYHNESLTVIREENLPF